MLINASMVKFIHYCKSFWFIKLNWEQIFTDFHRYSERKSLEHRKDMTGQAINLIPAKNKKIGLHFGIGESGVSQACRRITQRIEKDKKLKNKIIRLEKQTYLYYPYCMNFMIDFKYLKLYKLKECIPLRKNWFSY